MSGKNQKKEKKPQSKFGILGKISLWIGITVGVVVLALIVALWLYLWKFGFPSTDETQPTEPSQEVVATEPTTPETTQQVDIGALDEVNIQLGSGLEIRDVGSYTGIFMEDGSDEVVSGVLMALVVNNSEQDVQLLNFILTGNGQTANFSLSNLPAGASAVVLETGRMDYAPGFTEAVVANFASFDEPMTLCSDQIEIATYEKAMNITNISGEDIEGDVVIYYKNSAADVFYGGITYRVRIEGGIKAGEIRQIVPSHFMTGSSTIVHVTCG